MKRSILLPWLLLLLLIAAQAVWSSGLIAGWKFFRGTSTNNDSLVIDALDEMEASSDKSSIVLLELAKNRLDLANRQRSHVLELADRLVTANPRDPNPLILRGQVLRSSGRVHEAIKDFRAAKIMIESGAFKSEGFVPTLERMSKMLSDYEASAAKPE